MRKRSIYLVCEHFESADNTVIGRYMFFEIGYSRMFDILMYAFTPGQTLCLIYEGLYFAIGYIFVFIKGIVLIERNLAGVFQNG
jgi:hypothetical protein